MQSIKDNSKTKMNNIVQLGCLILKLLRLFVDFPSAIVGNFYRMGSVCFDPAIDVLTWLRLFSEDLTFLEVTALFSQDFFTTQL
jgi:hypothetical protein